MVEYAFSKKPLVKNPIQFVADGLPAYQKSPNKIFGKKTHHTRHIHLKGDRNNKMECLNGEIRGSLYKENSI